MEFLFLKDNIGDYIFWHVFLIHPGAGLRLKFWAADRTIIHTDGSNIGHIMLFLGRYGPS